VIDFIDMENSKNQRDVENRLRDSLRFDRARVQTAKISRFGLLELSRQRLQPSLGESNYITCPRCSGIGHIRGTESSALHILRIIQEEAMKDSSAAIHAQVPVDVATFLLNEKRGDIHRIESRLKVPVTLIPNPHLETPNYSINRLRQDELGNEAQQPSYTLVEKPEESRDTQETLKGVRAQAAVKGITPVAPAPMKAEQVVAAKPGLLSQIGDWFKSLVSSEPAVQEAPAVSRPPRARNERPERSERNDGSNRKRRDRNTERNATQTTEKPVEKTQEKSVPAEVRQPRPPRPPKKQTEPRIQDEKPVIVTPVAPAAIEVETEAEKTEKSNSRRRGRRGGRREREKREGVTTTEDNSVEGAENSVTAVVVTEPVVVRIVKPTEYIAMPSIVAPAISETTAEVVANEVVVSEVAKVAETEIVKVAETEIAKVAETEIVKVEVVKAAVITAKTAEPVTDLPSGLVQIETVTRNIAAVTEVPEVQSQTVIRRRTRKLEVYVENEPLVQIETQQH
jgi:ribonuclease E